MEGVWRSDAPVTIFLDLHIEAPTRKIRALMLLMSLIPCGVCVTMMVGFGDESP